VDIIRVVGMAEHGGDIRGVDKKERIRRVVEVENLLPGLVL
jgi:hypothetical protein